MSAPAAPRPDLVEGLQVNYYGAKTPHSPSCLAGGARAAPHRHHAIRQDRAPRNRKGDSEFGPGTTPQNDGKIIRIPIPELTQERRKELVKHVKKIAEEHRVGVRNHRRDANDMLKDLHKDKKITDDDMRASEAKIQQFTTDFIDKLDKVLAAKEAEIMEV